MSKKAEEIITEARRARGWTQAEMAGRLAEALGQTYSQRQYQKLEEGRFPKYKTEIVRAVDKLLEVNTYELIYGSGANEQNVEHNIHLMEDSGGNEYKTDRRVRQPKTETDPEKEGIRFIPISAQAGYARNISEPVFAKQLEKLYIPGFPYRGDRYAVFEVEGNSMEPTFKEHFHLLGEKVDAESWGEIREYYAYVVIFEDGVLIKRIKRSKQKGYWVLISDNELYEPFLVALESVKELWLVKRKMDWEMSPPKRFEIDL